MGALILYAGDCFCTSRPGKVLNTILKIGQYVHAVDRNVEFAHAGIIKDYFGDTTECLWTVASQNFYEAYVGCHVLVARPIVHPKVCCLLPTVLKLEAEHFGEWYPILRILLHAVGLARWFHIKNMVCSEYVAKFLWLIGVRHKYYFGTTPDILADEFIHWREYDVIFKGVLTKEMFPEHVKIYLGK